MEIRIKETGQLVQEGEFRALFPNTGFPIQLTAEIINDFGGDIVLEGPQPETTRYQTVYRDGVQQIDGQWFTKYNIADMNDEAKEAANVMQAKFVRQKRDDKLKDSDWRVIKSVETQSVFSPEWATYRQALRDISSAQGFPWDMTWPVEPT